VEQFDEKIRGKKSRGTIPLNNPSETKNCNWAFLKKCLKNYKVNFNLIQINLSTTVWLEDTCVRNSIIAVITFCHHFFSFLLLKREQLIAMCDEQESMSHDPIIAGYMITTPIFIDSNKTVNCVCSRGQQM
jgi:hypothetical protein